MPLSVVILAAGQGKRMRSALPKVLQPLAGRPLLAHVLETAASLDPAAIHVVYGHGASAVREAFSDRELGWWEQAEQLGTAHAVAQALPGIPDEHDVLVLYGDVPLIRADSLAALTAAAAGGLAVITAHADDPTGYGRIVRDSTGRVIRIVEQREAGPAEAEISEINTGILAAPAAKLRDWIRRIGNDNAQREYYLTDAIGLAVDDGVPVAAIVLTDASEAMGINDRIQLAAVERAFQRTVAQALMRDGATIADPNRIDVRGRLRVARDVFIDAGCVFLGDVVLGEGCRIGPYAVITDSKLGPGTVVHAHSVLDGVTTVAGCEIGPFARLRPGTELGDTVKVGNFVEMKKTRVGDGSKVNHLSYVGDATVGRKVNVGAGTITCNYDGANKHHTTIGDGAFIGSGVNLVAPVEVGAEATIGAGSTITEDTPAGGLTLARPRQTHVPGWRKPRKKQK